MICIGKTFIVGHQYNLLEDYAKQFPRKHQPKGFLDNFIYLLVGLDHDPVGLSEISKIPIDVPCLAADNIEHHSSLLTFTAWYYLAKHPELVKYKPFDISTSQTHLAILEYDAQILEPYAFQVGFMDCIEGKQIVSFSPFPTDHRLFLGQTPGLKAVLRDHHHIDERALESIIGEHKYWGATTNYMMPYSFLQGFVDWYMPMVPDMLKYTNHPHFHERAVSIYAWLNGYEIVFTPPYTVKHQQLNSHQYSI
jgi:hypothetical protein